MAALELEVTNRTIRYGHCLTMLKGFTGILRGAHLEERQVRETQEDHTPDGGEHEDENDDGDNGGNGDGEVRRSCSEGKQESKDASSGGGCAVPSTIVFYQQRLSSCPMMSGLVVYFLDQLTHAASVEDIGSILSDFMTSAFAVCTTAITLEDADHIFARLARDADMIDQADVHRAVCLSCTNRIIGTSLETLRGALTKTEHFVRIMHTYSHIIESTVVRLVIGDGLRFMLIDSLARDTRTASVYANTMQVLAMGNYAVTMQRLFRIGMCVLEETTIRVAINSIDQPRYDPSIRELAESMRQRAADVVLVRGTAEWPGGVAKQRSSADEC